MTKPRKYEPAKLIQMFRLAATLRKQMLEAGFTDNGGAIHSAERILNLLGMALNFPGLTHINNLRHLPKPPFSVDARKAVEAGNRVLIEHIYPHRALTRDAINKIEQGVSDEVFEQFVRDSFQLALLTIDETARLNRINRSRAAANRLADAGIILE